MGENGAFTEQLEAGLATGLEAAFQRSDLLKDMTTKLPFLSPTVLVPLITYPLKSKLKEAVEPIEKGIRTGIDDGFTKARAATDKIVCMRFYYASSGGIPSFLALKNASGDGVATMVKSFMSSVENEGKKAVQAQLDHSPKVDDMVEAITESLKAGASKLACLVTKMPAKVQPCCQAVCDHNAKVYLH